MTKLAKTPTDEAPPVALDITSETCPMTFVRVRLALDRLPPGGLLEIRLKGDEPRANVPRNAAGQGHAVLAFEELGDGVARLLLRKRG